MARFDGSSRSRRKFLRDAALVSAAAVAGSAGPKRAEAALPPGMGKATNFDLGMAPDRDTAGAVIVMGEGGMFVTFPDQIAGTAVVEMVGCKACTHSYSTNLGDDGRPYSYFSLKPGAVYEITDSPWLLRTEEDLVRRTNKPLRHFVFTFGDTTYQCIAEGLRAKLYFGNFGDIAAEL